MAKQRWTALSGIVFVVLMLTEPIHVEVLSRSPTGAGHVTQPSCHEHECTAAIGERTYHARSSTNLAHQPL